MVLSVASIDAAAATRPASDDLGTDVVIERTDETTLTYRLTFTPPVGHSAFNVTLGTAVELVDTGNMERRDVSRPGFTRLAWTGEGTPTVTFRYDVAESRYGSPIATERWLLAASPYVRLETSSASQRRTETVLFDGTGSRPTNAPDRVTVRGDQGFVEAGYVYVGPYSTYERTAPGRMRCVVFVPRAASMPAATYATTLERATTRLDVSDESSVVTGVVVPNVDETDEGVFHSEPLGFAGLALTDSGFVVSETSGESTWIHEYVHTRQEFELTGRTLWLSEATAAYYGHSISSELGVVDPATTASKLSGTPATRDAVLAEPATWETGRVPYTKGARVVAYLDYRIRELTNGSETFQDVFRRLNAKNESLTHSGFKNATAAVVGSRVLDDEIDRYVTTDAHVTVDVPLSIDQATRTPTQANGTPVVTSTPASPAAPEPAPARSTPPEGVDTSRTLIFGTFGVLLVVGAKLTHRRGT